MSCRRVISSVFGALVLAVGVLWICQGAGLVDWPRGSMIFNDRGWLARGVVLACTGVIVLWLGRRDR